MLTDILKIIAVLILLFICIGARDGWNERDAKFPVHPPASATK